MAKYLGFVTLVLVAWFVSPALAYVGPGAGITMLGALWAVIAAIVLAFGAVLFWPIRVLLKKWRKKPAQDESKLKP